MRLLLSSDDADGSLGIYQDARIPWPVRWGGARGVGAAPNRYPYVHVVRGSVSLNGTTLADGDESRLVFPQGQNAEVLVFDLRALEQPEN